MVKITNPDASKGYLPRVRGTVLTYSVGDQTYARAWPKPAGKAKSPGEWYSQQEFGIAARMAAHAHALDLDTAKAMVKGTSMVPRDFLMTAIMGTAYEFVDGPNGEHLESGRMAQNPQYILDGVSNTPGDILVRTDVGWQGLAKGAIDDVLVIAPNGLPAWAAGSSELQYTAGAWTPTLITDTVSPTGVTYALQAALYVHLTQAKLCWVSGQVNLSNKGTGGTGYAGVGNLPKVPSQPNNIAGLIVIRPQKWTFPTGACDLQGVILSTPAMLRPQSANNGGVGGASTWASLTNDASLAFAGWYHTT